MFVLLNSLREHPFPRLIWIALSSLFNFPIEVSLVGQTKKKVVILYCFLQALCVNSLVVLFQPSAAYSSSSYSVLKTYCSILEALSSSNLVG